MLSYRHAFHAGNHADVLKHVTLVALLKHLRRKEAPFCYIDSHSGKGLYDLADSMAEKNAEFRTGVGTLWGREFHDPLIRAYLDQIRGVNPPATPKPRFYPGSPILAQRLCRPQDKLILMELHSQEVALLKQNIGRDSRVHIHRRDGFEGLGGIVPPTPRRGLVLIDPAYEVKGDYDQVLRSAQSIHRKWPTGIVAIWFPLLATARDQGDKLKRHFQRAAFSNVLMAQLTVAPQQQEHGMHGSAMLVINPPWQLDAGLAQSLQTLAPLLVSGVADAVAVEWLKRST